MLHLTEYGSHHTTNERLNIQLQATRHTQYHKLLTLSSDPKAQRIVDLAWAWALLSRNTKTRRAPGMVGAILTLQGLLRLHLSNLWAWYQ